MHKQMILFVLTMILVGSHQKKIKIKLFYESLCSDSQNFINSYFTSKMPILLEYVDVEYIPYGKASHKINNNGGYDFTCQHGPMECYGNKIQACVTSQNTDQLKTLHFVNCCMSAMYDRQDYGDQLRQCADRASLNWEAIDNCANSQLGSRILAHYGDITHSFDHRLKFVPTVLVNNRHIIVESYEDFDRFFNEICKHLRNKPRECYSSTRYYN